MKRWLFDLVYRRVFVPMYSRRRAELDAIPIDWSEVFPCLEAGREAPEHSSETSIPSPQASRPDSVARPRSAAE